MNLEIVQVFTREKNEDGNRRTKRPFHDRLSPEGNDGNSSSLGEEEEKERREGIR